MSYFYSIYKLLEIYYVEKNSKDLYPSLVIKVNEKHYFLKSIVRHEGTLHGGHYKTGLYMGKFWVTCNDNHDLTIDYTDPTDGYLFFYENKKQVNTSKTQVNTSRTSHA